MLFHFVWLSDEALHDSINYSEWREEIFFLIWEETE